MVSLLDIAPSKATVSVNGTDVEVKGISAEGIAYLLAEYPSLRAALSGRGFDVTPTGLMEFGPKFVASVIAAGTGTHGSKEAEAIAASLPIGVQLDFLDEIIKQTLPGGVGPFVEKLEQLLGVAGVSAAGGKALATKSRRPSKG